MAKDTLDFIVWCRVNTYLSAGVCGIPPKAAQAPMAAPRRPLPEFVVFQC